MIPYTRDPRQTIPLSAVKIIGLGGAGTNMLERIALDGMDGAELLALNTDLRTLDSCLAKEKIQLGVTLTKGLGTGGDPELGHQAVLEAEGAIRAAVAGHRIVFICAGLGGGTGSGAAPMVTRLAREEGAFVVVFATMPFAFEGKRRRDQAETALNELAVLSNALVTFDNNRMGELVLAKQGIHEAFVAADLMICESMKAVIRLVVRPGLINIGLDDLMSALRTNRSRCLFGSGLASGTDRAARALQNALASPLLDQGALLKETSTVLVHLCGGENLTLFEIELLMQRLQKCVPETAHVLFGAAVDPAMGDSLSLTLISALPEDSLAMVPRAALSEASLVEPAPDLPQPAPVEPVVAAPAVAAPAPVAPTVAEPVPTLELQSIPAEPAAGKPASLLAKIRRSLADPAPAIETPTLFGEATPAAEPEAPAMAADFLDLNLDATPVASEPPPEATPARIADFVAAEPDPQPIEEDPDFQVPAPEAPGFTAIPRKRPLGISPWSTSQGPKSLAPELEAIEAPPAPEPELPKLKLVVKANTPQSELSLDSTPRGRFEGESPNVFEGEDLDLPPFLRKKK
ncbi:MAG: cell division protein FtsZ [Verrucomicrobiota bacterium]